MNELTIMGYQLSGKSNGKAESSTVFHTNVIGESVVALAFHAGLEVSSISFTSHCLSVAQLFGDAKIVALRAFFTFDILNFPDFASLAISDGQPRKKVCFLGGVVMVEQSFKSYTVDLEGQFIQAAE